MNFKDECLLKAKYLAEAANGTKFQTLTEPGTGRHVMWVDVQFPTFDGRIEKWRRTPIITTFTRILLWVRFPNQKEPSVYVFSNSVDVDAFFVQHPEAKLLKKDISTLETQE